MASAHGSILVVDDEKDIAAIVTHFLEECGYKTRGFTDPLKALEHFCANPADHDVIVSDIRMPRMSGFELVGKMKEIKSGIRVILMSACEIGSPEFDAALLRAKVDGFIQKPMSVQALVSLIEKHA